jgi:cation transport ATPase
MDSKKQRANHTRDKRALFGAMFLLATLGHAALLHAHAWRPTPASMLSFYVSVFLGVETLCYHARFKVENGSTDATWGYVARYGSLCVSLTILALAISHLLGSEFPDHANANAALAAICAFLIGRALSNVSK